jgi:inosine-uridine nucleoside N-ribohydrolase
MSVTPERRKVIIDADPGVDDAMSIFVALERHRRREIEILAITLGPMLKNFLRP